MTYKTQWIEFNHERKVENSKEIQDEEGVRMNRAKTEKAKKEKLESWKR